MLESGSHCLLHVDDSILVRGECRSISCFGAGYLAIAASLVLRASVLGWGKARQLRVRSDRHPAVTNQEGGWRVSMFARFVKVFSMMLRH